MHIEDFDFVLPEARIALEPARPRDTARLLHVPRSGAFADLQVRDALAVLRPGDLVVLNETRVVRAALSAIRPSREENGNDVAIQLNLHARAAPDAWRAFARPAKRLQVGDALTFSDRLCARIEARGERGDMLLRFDRGGEALDAAIAAIGQTPLPPYIAAKRAITAQDVEDYQTVYAARDGAVAAPTAGLHFTNALLSAFEAAGVEIARLTLHVGAGTFLPVSAPRIEDHTMHAEWREISHACADQINQARSDGRRVVAIGTTVLRALESAADDEGRVRVETGETDIFITPGYRFKAVDALWTNFHLPRSTLFMLVCAFAGTARMRAAYAHAIEHQYRFYSYGDATFLERADTP